MNDQTGIFIPENPVDDAFSSAVKNNPYVSEGAIAAWKAELNARIEKGVEPTFQYLSFLTNVCSLTTDQILKQFEEGTDRYVALDTVIAENKGLLPVIRKTIRYQPAESTPVRLAV